MSDADVLLDVSVSETSGLFKFATEDTRSAFLVARVFPTFPLSFVVGSDTGSLGSANGSTLTT